ncbi:TKL protein kinase, variant [Thecamonas trahens ATCC 50062]|uniref:TKL protein kinase, variant n=1 Tax=Thecamonas trahens ATCC 50062 TaxID=461836 RepID=A0A0L0D1X5_THETB|nr:TKL protein kinase, variant [Thecamonas trahens ATCC 50062]KNC46206.1 TKL protein kinase, variant [Thecamonas trahens ATCC 50062]|eukprot:XP_013760503.1 TKL protein kinase, variant [Thecamonas trahens ATCC 50062]
MSGGVQELVRAARAGDLERVQELVEGGVAVKDQVVSGVNDRVVYQDTALTGAARMGRKNVVQWLVGSAVVGVEDGRTDGWTAAMAAAWGGHLDVMQWLVSKGGADVDKANNKGWTPLCIAAQKGHKDVVEWLVNEGRADVDKANNKGWTPLYIAAQKGHKDVVEWLVGKGKAAVDKALNNGATPLYIAARSGHLDVVKWLVSEGGAEVDKASNSGATPLFIAAHNGHLDVVKWLVGEGKADVNMTLTNGVTPLYIAARSGHLDVVKWLVSEGEAEVDKASNNGATPLYIAAHNRHLDVVKWLVGEGKAAVDKDLNNGATPLYIAAHNGHLDVAEWLVGEGKAAVNTTLTNGVTPLYMAAEMGCLDAVQWLVYEGRAAVDMALKNGATPLYVAAAKGQLDMVRWLVNGGRAAVDKAKNNGGTPLYVAAQHNHLEVVICLVAAGGAKVIPTRTQALRAFVDAQPLDVTSMRGYTRIINFLRAVQTATVDGHAPLLGATLKADLDLLSTLIAAGAPLESFHDGQTVLMHATAAGLTEVVVHLLRFGAAANTVDSNGNTALHVAAAHGHVDISRVLVTQGRARIHQENNGGETPLHAALRGNDVALFLLDTPTPPKPEPWLYVYSNTQPGLESNNMPTTAAPSSHERVAMHDLEVFKEDELGHGAHARVFRGLRAKTPVAVKVLFTQELAPEADVSALQHSLKDEAVLLGKLRDPNIVQFLGLSMMPATNHSGPRPALVFELMERGSLFDYHERYGRFPPQVAAALALDAARGLAYLHSKGVVHGDMKSPNLLLSGASGRMRLKVADFGLAKLKGNGVATTNAGTFRWMAPEVMVSGKENTYGKEADVFSFGVVMWELAAGSYPYKGTGLDERGIRQAVLQDEIRPEFEPSMGASEVYVALARKCWSASPAQRPGMTAVVDKLEIIEAEEQKHSLKRWDVFICHGGGDKGAALDLYDDLTARGLCVFLDSKSLDGERCEYPDDLADHVRASRVVIVLVSKHMMVTHWAIAEAKAALAEADAGRCKLLPVFICSDISPNTLRHAADVDTADPQHLVLRIMDASFLSPDHAEQYGLWRHPELTPARKADHVATVYALENYGAETHNWHTTSPSRALADVANRAANLVAEMVNPAGPST